MVRSKNKNKAQRRSSQAKSEIAAKVTKIGASTPYDFKGRRMTPYGGLLPLTTMLEKLEFKKVVEETLTVRRLPRSMKIYQFILSILLGLYIGFDRLSHLVHISYDPIITGILHVVRLPVQSTFWRFLSSLMIFNVPQLVRINSQMMSRVWQAANVRLEEVTLDTDTTVNTIYGKQAGGRKGYNPQHRGKRSYQPILTFIAETGEHLKGSQRTGDNLSGKEIAKHLRQSFALLPDVVKKVRSRADAGFYCRDAVEVHREYGHDFIIVAQKTSGLVRQLEQVEWQRAMGTEGVTSFMYQPQGWSSPERFVAVRYKKEKEEGEQYQLFETDIYKYRVFVTNMKGRPIRLIDFYDGRAGAENLIKEANNDVGLASVPSGNFIANMNFFQLVMLAYNFNRWLMLFNLNEGEEYKRTMLSTARLMYLFIAAKIWRHSGYSGVRYSDHYPEKEQFDSLMFRLRRIRKKGGSFMPVFSSPFVNEMG